MSDRIEAVIAHLNAHADPARIPPAAHAAAMRFTFDSIGVALAGTARPESAVLAAAASGWGSGRDARVWGTGEWLPAPSAALCNAFHIHNQEYDCVHERAVVHPMAVILAALLAFAEREGGVSGPRLTGALALAVDTAAVIGMSAQRSIRFFRPAQCGCLGAVAGLAVLAGLSAQATRDAFGLAYSQLAGTMQAHVEGSPALPLQVGLAARAALCAVDLARAGFGGPHRVLDGPHGYFTLFEPNAAPDAAFAELGRVWQIERVSHKPYPTGRAAQGAIAGLRQLRAAHGFAAEEVQKVTLAAPPLVRQLVDRPWRPDMTVNYARLCLPFLLATVLRHDGVGLDAYTPDRLRDPALGEWAARMCVVPDTNTDPNALRPQHLSVLLTDGSTLEASLPYVYGAPEAPFPAAEQRAKFLACATFGTRALAPAAAERLLDALQDIAHASCMRDLVTLTVPS
jgi:2-methylcitrate dehydratase PrpD